MKKMTKNKMAVITGIGLAATGLAMPANAQSAQPAVNLAISPVQQFANYMADRGVTFSSNYLGEFAANPAGGERQGAELTGEFNLGAQVDMEKAAGIKGGTLSVLFTDRAGNNLTEKSINNSIFVQQIYGDGQTYQLTEFNYEQLLFNNMLDVKIGRIDISEDYATSGLYCDFSSFAICSNPNLIEQDVFNGSSYYPLAVWGGTAKFNPLPDWYIKGGIYQNTPDANPVAGHGFNWGEPSDGFQLPVEIGYSHTQPGAEVPDQYDIGVIMDRTHYDAPFYSATSPTRYGRSALYLQAQKLLYQPEPNSPRGLYGFAEASFSLSGKEQDSNYSMEAGLVDQGPFASRPLDMTSAAISVLHYNDNYLNYLYAGRMANGGTEYPYHHMIMMEVNYAAQITPWLNLMPNLQYIIHPDGLGGLGYPNQNIDNAFVVGLQFSVNVARLVGLAK